MTTKSNKLSESYQTFLISSYIYIKEAVKTSRLRNNPTKSYKSVQN